MHPPPRRRRQAGFFSESDAESALIGETDAGGDCRYAEIPIAEKRLCRIDPFAAQPRMRSDAH